MLKKSFFFVIISITIVFLQIDGIRKMKKLIDWIGANKNKAFLTVCLVIHVIYTIVFYRLQIRLLAYLNIFSANFYFYHLFIKKNTSEESMVSAYYEIILFSALSEFALGPSYGFFLYMVGMSATIFYLIPSYKHKRFIYQIIGIVSALLTESLIMIGHIQILGIQETAVRYQPVFFLANLGITASIVLAATFFYSKETESVWETLRYNMNHDTLTGLYTRRFLEKHIETIPHNKRRQYVISMIDIDFFKKVNDTYGHEAGDAVLVNVSNCLQETVGTQNLAVRWGGEEFILYFPDTTPEVIYPKIEKLRMQVENMVTEVSGKEIHVTITGGVATGLADSNYEKVIRCADEKLYLGKQRGRNCVIV